MAKRDLQFWRTWLFHSGRWLLVISGIAGVILLLLIFAGAFHTKVDSTAKQRQRTVPTNAVFVEVRSVTQPRFESAIGTIKPVHEASVASKILARVLDVSVTAGKQVNAGDVLVRLSDDEQKSRVQQAEAERDSMQAQTQLAQIEFDRAAQLVVSRSISQAEYDTARTRLKTSQANLDRASRTVDEAKVFLGFATVVAPFSGVVIDKVVESGDTVSPGQALLTLYDPTHMQMVASVRESLAMKLSVGQQLPARLDSLGYECRATVSEIVPKADASSRSFDVKVTGPCPSGVYSGMFARLLLPLEDEQLLLVPKASVQRVGQLTLVMVNENGTMVRRAVQLGREFSDQVEVLAGLSDKEKVLVPSAQYPGTEDTSAEGVAR